MVNIWIEFPDKSKKEYAAGITPAEILKQLNGRLARESVAARVNDTIIDLSRPIFANATLEFITTDEADGMQVFWHSSAHIMAHAIKQLYPEAKFGFGPAEEDGFYYDFSTDTPISSEDLPKIEEKMRAIAAADLPFVRSEISAAEALKLFRERNEDFKVEHIPELDGNQLSIYQEGDFIDLCTGPHLPSTGWVKHVKLLSIAGAYWRDNEKNPMLQRIRGVAFPKKSLLDAHLERIEEAKKRDHRKLGRDLDLFSTSADLGPGLILWHPKGALIRHLIEDFWRKEHLKNGYDLVNSPHIARLDLWQTSGHLDFYHDNMYKPIEVDQEKYQVKPMNCPFHLLIYKSQPRSYRDLPLRWAELGTVYRYERSGVLHGLLRVRGFTQDDAHIFCRPDQLDDEIGRLLDFTTHILGSFGFKNLDVYLSTRPDSYVGTLENWDRATEALRAGLEKKNIQYRIDPGEGVFYGPKIDIKIRDAIGRSWQCTTIQVDFNEPERFDITFIGTDGQSHRPIMLHRALLGSIERFFGTLIEHYAGALPVWLAPVQVMLLPITSQQQPFAQALQEKLLALELRTHLDDRNEKVGFKIREAEMQKIPYMLVIGQKEVEDNLVAVRKRRQGDLGKLTIEQFITQIQSEIGAKSSD